jgi:acyl-CoA synthetase (AMP-forming)/AMP-acid ligase II
MRLWDDRKLRDGIEAAAATHPDGFAVAEATQRLDHRAFSRLVSSGLARLRAAGLTSGDSLILVTGNSVAGIVAYHASLRLGLVEILLDRRCGQADLRHAESIAGEDVVCALPRSERTRLFAGRTATRVIDLDASGAITEARSDLPDWTEPNRDTPAVVLFTSGTTSRPKAVVHSLNTLTAGARNMAAITDANRETVEFLASPLASITGVMQMHLAADQHATIVLEDDFDAASSLARCEEYGATLLGGAPVIAERLLRAATARGLRALSLRTLALGGAMLPRPLLDLATRDFGLQVARVYGSSEFPNATGSLPSDSLERRLADDGALMPGTEIRAGSKQDAREGLIRGPALFLGYADPADDADAFEDGWYRSGDAIELAGGHLTVVGRLKDVVNRNGLKISLSEIEAALARLPGALEIACFGLPDPETGERLAVAAHVEADAGIHFDTMIEYLRRAGVATRKLPEELFLWSEPLPRTDSGYDHPFPSHDGVGRQAESGRRATPILILPRRPHVPDTRRSGGDQPAHGPLLPATRSRRRRGLGRSLRPGSLLRGLWTVVGRS